ncbi:MAG: hypothetical protein MRY32_07120, partial [Rickettsiales bacterium]|nr:hypothetical protein [Rickettsiales bacterium]
MSEPETIIEPNPPAEKPSMAMRVLHLVWNQRQHVANAIYLAGNALGWLYEKFPLPKRVKDITTEITYHAIEHFIVQSKGYQNWLHRRAGLTRLHGLFQSDEEPVTKVVAPPKAPTDA